MNSVWNSIFIIFTAISTPFPSLHRRFPWTSPSPAPAADPLPPGGAARTIISSPGAGRGNLLSLSGSLQDCCCCCSCCFAGQDCCCCCSCCFAGQDVAVVLFLVFQDRTVNCSFSCCFAGQDCCCCCSFCCCCSLSWFAGQDCCCCSFSCFAGQ